MSPEKNTTSPQRPSRGQSASRMGYFGILGEIVGLTMALFVGIRFLMTDTQPDTVAWVSFGIGAVLLIDLIRRIWLARRRGLAE